MKSWQKSTGTLVILPVTKPWHNVFCGPNQGICAAWGFLLSKATYQRRLPAHCLRASAAVCLLVILSLALPLFAENKTPRKLVYRENPGYPLTLREAHIGGIVRLEIMISAKGSVDSIIPLGGNPVLVEAASAAVRRWKYAPADAESKTQVEFTFDPKH